MANKKSTKKRAITNQVRRIKNIARKSELKTMEKKVETALEKNDAVSAKDMLKITEAKIARAAGKGVLKKNTASRKISRLAKKVASLEKTQEA
ncbi:30S ribosomal protein S20 [Candidatus Babeliales bacterium]|nr:30S ribosomal protein S20 [Candidatus Babeliales bacterium]